MMKVGGVYSLLLSPNNRLILCSERYDNMRSPIMVC